jgi:hypothetical protein
MWSCIQSNLPTRCIVQPLFQHLSDESIGDIESQLIRKKRRPQSGLAIRYACFGRHVSEAVERFPEFTRIGCRWRERRLALRPVRRNSINPFPRPVSQPRSANTTAVFGAGFLPSNSCRCIASADADGRLTISCRRIRGSKFAGSASQ